MKALSIALAAALAALLIYPASAEEVIKQGNAGVIIAEGNGPEIIEPGPGDISGVSSRIIHFGEQAASNKLERYASLENNRDPALDDQLLGVAISNTRAETDWRVEVQISGFYTGAQETLRGFRLQLAPHSGLITNNPAGNRPQVQTVELYAAEDGGPGPLAPIFSAHEDGSVGQWGGNWSGELTVPAGSAREGTAQAVMNWKIISTAKE